MPLPLGKKDATPLRSRFHRYSELRQLFVKDSQVTLPPFPATFGHADAYPGDKWDMLGNGPDNTVFEGFQGCGDCAWAGPAHEIMESAATSGNNKKVTFSGKTVVAQYSAYSGYNPKTGAGDTGSNVQDVLEHRQTKGIYDDAGNVHKIGQAVQLTAGNLQELWEASYLFERVGIGIQVQEAQQEQFAEGKAWTYQPGSPVEGGHYVPVMGKDGLVSWARRVGYTTSFIVNLCDEAWTYIDPELYNTVTGETAEHYADQDLEKYLVLVARAKFPA